MKCSLPIGFAMLGAASTAAPDSPTGKSHEAEAKMRGYWQELDPKLPKEKTSRKKRKRRTIHGQATDKQPDALHCTAQTRRLRFRLVGGSWEANMPNGGITWEVCFPDYSPHLARSTDFENEASRRAVRPC
jgi:hypothetical protein